MRILVGAALLSVLTACSSEREAPPPPPAAAGGTVRDIPSTPAVGTAPLAGLADPSVGPEQEPPLRLMVELGDERHLALAGAPVTLADGRTLTVHLQDQRVFTHGGLRFAYPRHYSFEAELAPDLEQWILSGNDHKIMVFRHPLSADHEQVRRETIRAMRSRYGDAATASPVTVQLGEGALRGTRLHATVVGVSFVQDVVSMPGDDESYVLVLQNSRPGEPNAEAERAMELLRTTFARTPGR